MTKGNIELPLEIDLAAASNEGKEKAAPANTCRDFDLLKIKGWPETKTVMELRCVKVFGKKICTKVPVIYTRECELKVVARICHPQLQDILGDVQSCLKQAVIAGVIGGLVADDAQVASATLTGYLKACLLSKIGQRASQITAQVSPHSSSCSNWH